MDSPTSGMRSGTKWLVRRSLMLYEMPRPTALSGRPATKPVPLERPTLFALRLKAATTSRLLCLSPYQKGRSPRISTSRDGIRTVTVSSVLLRRLRQPRLCPPTLQRNQRETATRPMGPLSTLPTFCYICNPRLSHRVGTTRTMPAQRSHMEKRAIHHRQYKRRLRLLLLHHQPFHRT